ncbi:MAG: hypothetical protein P8Y48_13915 [Novosphingobium sp.]
MIFRSRTAASLAALAALSMTASPAFAHGYRDGHYRHYRHHHHHHGGSGTGLLAGLLIGGAAVAIASAASKSRRDKVREEPAGYPDGPYDSRYERDYAPPLVPGRSGAEYPGGPGAGTGFDGAADICASEIERGDYRIGSVDNVRRMGGRYSVAGHLEDGRGYACSVDDNGRVRSVAVDGHAMI